TTEQFLADRNRCHFACSLDRIPFVDELVITEENDADVILFEVQRHSKDAVRELDKFRGQHVRQPVDTSNAVADLQHRADIVDISLAREAGQLFAKNRSYFIGTNFNHIASTSVVRKLRYAVGTSLRCWVGVEPRHDCRCGVKLRTNTWN